MRFKRKHITLIACLVLAVLLASLVSILIVRRKMQKPSSLLSVALDDKSLLINSHFGETVHSFITEDSPTLGNNTLGVQIVVFSDYNCSHCQEFDEQALRLVRDFDNKIELVFKFFPLDSDCNPYIDVSRDSTSCEAAAAAYLAYEQGRFWEYHALLFANFMSYEREELLTYAEEANINDLKSFENLLGDEILMRRLRIDVLEGVAAGVSHTPSIFLNGRFGQSLRGPWDSYYLLLRDTIQELLPKAENKN